VALAAHGVVTAGRSGAAWIRAAYGLPEWRVAGILYGIDPAELPPPPARADHPGVRFLYVGQYTGRKGSGVLERTLPPLAAEHPDARLTFVVPESAVGAVGRAYRPAWGDRLVVRSWVPRRELWELYGGHDVLLFPTYFEGYGKVAVEALAMGCAVVGFAEGALADIGSPACLTCPVGDVGGFAGLLRAVAGRRPDPRDLADTAVRDGRRRTWADTAAETIDFFHRLRDHYPAWPPAPDRAAGR
jgi:glycosyltransferase involved in cell wall biosynthesis